jgi:hypothetical protein
MFITEHNQKRYDEVFDSVYAFLKLKMHDDLEDQIKELEGFLEDQYILEGQDWLGRSEGKEIAISATIAACEVLIDELRSQLKQKNEKTG